jgi:hypothetical protein
MVGFGTITAKLGGRAVKKKRQQVQVRVDPDTHEKFLEIKLTNSVRRQLAPMKRKAAKTK